MTKSEHPIAGSISKDAHALRPMRIGRDEIPIHYEATTFPKDPYVGCELLIRRMEVFGMLARRDGRLKGAWFLDVLDSDGDILDTLEVNGAGVKYMRRTLRMKRESSVLQESFDSLALNITKK